MGKNKERIYLFLIITFLIGSCFFVYKTYEAFSGYFVQCSTLTNCRTCAEEFGCVWCESGQGRCMSDLSSNILCRGSSIASSAAGCSDGVSSLSNVGNIGTLADASGNIVTYGQCSRARNCNDCISGSPDCLWCASDNKCVSSMNANTCTNSRLYHSILQCSLSNTSSSMYVSPSAPYSGESVIPIVGLSRDNDDRLTDSSLKIIKDSLDARGYTVTDNLSKTRVLGMIQSEMNFYKNQFKSSIGDFVNKSLDYVADGTSLTNAKQGDKKVQDLRDISRYINSIDVSKFTEGYSNLDTEESIFEYAKDKNNMVSRKLQMFCLANLVVLGTLFLI